MAFSRVSPTVVQPVSFHEDNETCRGEIVHIFFSKYSGWRSWRIFDESFFGSWT